VQYDDIGDWDVSGSLYNTSDVVMGTSTSSFCVHPTKQPSNDLSFNVRVDDGSTGLTFIPHSAR
jgi:hypothetical protein